MTCIVGLVNDGVVWIGGDSLAGDTSTYVVSSRKDPKVFIHGGEFLIGYTSSFRMGQIIRYHFIPPKIVVSDLYWYMVTKFVKELRVKLLEEGFSTKENNRELGGEFLVGIRGRLFGIHSDFQVSEAREGYTAVGSGYQLALGSLHNKGVLLSPRRRVLSALRAAEAHSAYVRRPFVVKHVGTPGIPGR